MTPSSVATSAVVIVIVLVSLLTPCKGRNSMKVSHPNLTHRGTPPDSNGHKAGGEEGCAGQVLDDLVGSHVEVPLFHPLERYL